MEQKNEFTAMAREAEKQQEEPMEWKPECDISELPPRLRRLAEFRKNACNTVNYFPWEETEEGFDFWDDVNLGIVPSNLEDVLDKFEKEHPELRGGEEAESNATDGAGKAFEFDNDIKAALEALSEVYSVFTAAVSAAKAVTEAANAVVEAKNAFESAKENIVKIFSRKWTEQNPNSDKSAQ